MIKKGKLTISELRDYSTALFILIAVAGCGVFSAGPDEEVYQAVSETYTIESPENWLRIDKPEKTIFTRDGPSLQKAVVYRVSPEKILVYSEKRPAPGTSPWEIMKFMMSAELSKIGKANCSAPEKSFTVIGGRPGFRLVYACKYAESFKRKFVLYGIVAGQWLYKLEYNAVARHYFQRGIDDFERMATSIKFP